MSGVPDRRKRLLVVSPSLSGGGAERFASTLLCNIDRNRFDCQLCLMRKEISYPLPNDILTTALNKSRPWHIPRTIGLLRGLYSKINPDVVLGVMEPVSWLMSAAMIGLRPPPLFVARFATSFERKFSLADRLTLPLVRALVRRADIVVGNSHRTGRQLAGRLKVGACKVKAIWNPINVDHIESASKMSLPAEEDRRGAAVILAVGRLEKVKRPDILIEAFARVREKMDAQLWVCGDGPLIASVEHQIESCAMQDHISLLGFDPNPYRWMAKADVFAITSDFEGFPNALIEAQALGLPAVATRCPTGPDEIVEDGVTGLLVPVGDVDAIARAILDLLSDKYRLRQMGAAARRRARSLFDHKKIIAQWEDVLDPQGREDRG